MGALLRQATERLDRLQQGEALAESTVHRLLVQCWPVDTFCSLRELCIVFKHPGEACKGAAMSCLHDSHDKSLLTAVDTLTAHLW